VPWTAIAKVSGAFSEAAEMSVGELADWYERSLFSDDLSALDSGTHDYSTCTFRALLHLRFDR
jgi:hypothetical protein